MHPPAPNTPMSTLIKVGIHSKQRRGKSTLATLLQDRLTARLSRAFERRSFANALKDFCAAVAGKPANYFYSDANNEAPLVAEREDAHLDKRQQINHLLVMQTANRSPFSTQTTSMSIWTKCKQKFWCCVFSQSVFWIA